MSSPAQQQLTRGPRSDQPDAGAGCPISAGSRPCPISGNPNRACGAASDRIREERVFHAAADAIAVHGGNHRSRVSLHRDEQIVKPSHPLLRSGRRQAPSASLDVAAGAEEPIAGAGDHHRRRVALAAVSEQRRSWRAAAGGSRAVAGGLSSVATRTPSWPAVRSPVSRLASCRTYGTVIECVSV